MRALLDKLGISAKYKGYRMLIYAIILIAMMLFNWAPKSIELRQKYSFKNLFHKKAKEVQ